MSLTGSTVVVIGGGSGVGLATAKLARERGAGRIVITGRSAHKLEEAARQVEGVEISAFDAGDADAARAFFQGLGSVDHVVLAASGGEGGGPFAPLDLAALRRGFEAKFWVHITAAQAAVPSLSESGSLTFVTSASSRMANAGTAGLGAINGAIERMVPTLALELAPRRVNAVSPGVIETGWWDQFGAQRDSMLAQYAAAVPVRRNGTPEEVADAILFAAGNGFLTGVVIDCDGGLRLR